PLFLEEGRRKCHRVGSRPAFKAAAEPRVAIRMTDVVRHSASQSDAVSMPGLQEARRYVGHQPDGAETTERNGSRLRPLLRRHSWPCVGSSECRPGDSNRRLTDKKRASQTLITGGSFAGKRFEVASHRQINTIW